MCICRRGTKTIKRDTRINRQKNSVVHQGVQFRNWWAGWTKQKPVNIPANTRKWTHLEAVLASEQKHSLQVGREWQITKDSSQRQYQTWKPLETYRRWHQWCTALHHRLWPVHHSLYTSTCGVEFHFFYHCQWVSDTTNANMKKKNWLWLIPVHGKREASNRRARLWQNHP